MKHKLMLLAALVAGATGCDSSGNKKTIPENTIPAIETAVDPTVDASVITFNDLPVHDPSVIKVEEQVTTGEGDDAVTTTVDAYYVFGSHLAAARSTDLMNWTHISAPAAVFGDLTNSEGNVFNTGVNFADNPLFPDYATELSDAVAYTGGVVGSWASDVIQLADGQYYFYYNHCANPLDGNCNSSRSYLGLAVSDSIQGPYTDLGVFLHSGQTDAEMVMAEYQVGDLTAYDGNIHPNAIDPDVFYDKNGNLWMVYGSYSGGIFILAMDETTGFPEPDQGYGTHLTGGFYSAIEGPYIFYSPETDYYYLFTSFGGFLAGDGYNIRVSRSRNPNGPYLDAEGNDMVNASGNWDGIAPYGVKLMGGFNFPADLGETKSARGYLAPGHNSAYYDAESGKHFLITHTRFPGRAEEHSIRVHELFVNSDDWLVASPHRYVPIDGGNVVDRDDLFGDWQIVNHGKDINREAKVASYAKFTDKGTIEGDATGNFQLYSADPEAITVNLSGVGSFKGVMKWQWDESLAALVPTFTGVSATGATVWGTKLPERSDADTVQAVADALNIEANLQTTGIILPTEGTRGVNISWESSNEFRLDPADGSIVRPNVGEGNQPITVTATITLFDEELVKVFDSSIIERSTFNRTAHFAFEDNLDESLGNFTDPSTVVGNRPVDTVGAVSYVAGNSGQAVNLDGTSGVVLPTDLIKNYEYTVSMWVNPTVLEGYSPAFFGSATPSDWFSIIPGGARHYTDNTQMWSLGKGIWSDALAGETIPVGTWTHVALSVNKGVAQLMLNGEVKASGQIQDIFTGATGGVFTLGVNYWDLPFNGAIDELKIYDAALTGAEIIALDIANTPTADLLDSAVAILDLGDVSLVKSDIYLPVTGPYASAIVWSSSDTSVVDVVGDYGIITRPPRGADNATASLTATITLGDQTSTKTFEVIVASLTPPEPVALFSFENDLTDSTGNFAAGTVTGDRINNTGGTISYTAGISGNALQVNPEAGVRLPDNLVTDNSWAFSMWLNPTAITGFTTAFFGGVPNDTDSTQWISVLPGGVNNGQIMLWFGSAPFQDALTGQPLTVGQWTHFAGVYFEGQVTLYVDGVQYLDAPGFSDQFTGANSIWAIGVNFWDTPYNGLIDELRVYDETLTSDDVAELYQAGAPQ